MLGLTQHIYVRMIKDVARSQRSGDGDQLASDQSRRWRDIFWLVVFTLHLVVLGYGLVYFGRYGYAPGFKKHRRGLTKNYWPVYAVAGGVGTGLGCTWLLLLGSHANVMMKVAVHILTTYLAVISVLCFWAEQFFWGVVFATGAALQFLYVISVIDRYELEVFSECLSFQSHTGYVRFNPILKIFAKAFTQNIFLPFSLKS